MPAAIDYAQPLRTIGQALEILRMESFELESEGDDFIVRGQVTVAGTGSSAPSTESRQLRFTREPISEGSGAEPGTEAPAIVNRLDLCYTLKDVARLEHRGQERRGEPPSVEPGPRLSHELRTIGAYLEEKPARLVRIAKRQESLTVVYETLSGVRIEEKLDRATLREWEARMSVNRGARVLH